MSLLIATATDVVPLTVSRADAHPPNSLGDSAPAETSNQSRGHITQNTNQLMAALEVVNRGVDRSLFDIDALSQQLGSDPVAMFQFVRDQIRYEPYFGVLRGAQGTLVSRAGNLLVQRRGKGLP